MPPDHDGRKTPPAKGGPKVLLFDLPQTVLSILRDADICATATTFGRPYPAGTDGRYHRIHAQPRLPDCSGTHVVVIDLTAPEAAAAPPEATSPDEGSAWITLPVRGVIDPRPYNMYRLQGALGQVFADGGVFIVFAQPRLWREYSSGRQSFHQIKQEHALRIDNYSFLPFLHKDNLCAEPSFGSVEQACEGEDPVSLFLRARRLAGRYTAFGVPQGELISEPRWKARRLFVTPDGDPVGIRLDHVDTRGVLLLLPQLEDKETLLRDLMTEALRQVSPHLFPRSSLEWISEEPYQHESVLALRRQQQEVRRKADEEVAALEVEITRKGDELRFLHGLLTATGAELVESTRAALAFLGFSGVEMPTKAPRPDLPCKRTCGFWTALPRCCSR